MNSSYTQKYCLLDKNFNKKRNPMSVKFLTWFCTSYCKCLHYFKYMVLLLCLKSFKCLLRYTISLPKTTLKLTTFKNLQTPFF